MIALWIILAILALLVLFILFGNVKLRVLCRDRLRVVVSVCGIRFTLFSDKDPKHQKTEALKECKHPNAVLKKELRRQKAAAKKAERKRLKALKKAERKQKQKQEISTGKRPNPNLKENLEMIVALLKKLYEVTRGNVRIKLRRWHLSVGTDDAAKTAILYGVVVQISSYLFNFVEEKFTHLQRRAGDVDITTDYVSGKCSADIDLICSVKIRKAIAIAVSMLFAYQKERKIAYKKAKLRQKQSS